MRSHSMNGSFAGTAWSGCACSMPGRPSTTGFTAAEQVVQRGLPRPLVAPPVLEPAAEEQEGGISRQAVERLIAAEVAALLAHEALIDPLLSKVQPAFCLGVDKISKYHQSTSKMPILPPHIQWCRVSPPGRHCSPCKASQSGN